MIVDANAGRQVYYPVYSEAAQHARPDLAEAGLFTRSTPDIPEPDLQMHFLPVKFWRQAEVDPDVDAFTAAVVLVHVHSSGSVRLRSADPTWAPAIDAGYLTNAGDAARLADPAFRDVIAEAVVVAVQRVYLTPEVDTKTGVLRLSELRKAIKR